MKRFKINYALREKISLAAVFVFITLVMLLCNFLTEFCADDYIYMNSFKTGERIDSFFEIFPSMASHAELMNGRLVSHFLAQLFLLLPLPIFKILNTAVFVLEIFLVSRISGSSKKYEPFLLFCAFALIWVYEPAFGQVNLWLDGSCNYLWSSVAALAFIYPYAALFLKRSEIKHICSEILFCVLGFFTGAFSESAAITAIFVAALMILIFRLSGIKIRIVYYIAPIFSVGGLVFMLGAPAELNNKLSDMTLGSLRVNFIAALEMIKKYRALLILFAILAVAAYYFVEEKKTLILSCVLALGGLCANFVHIFASYYPERCASFSVIMFAAADIALIVKLLDTNCRIALKCTFAAFLVIFSYNLFIGVNDIYSSYVQMNENIQRIEECKKEGILDVELPMFSPHSKYSAVSGLKYLDTQTSDTWPNNSMSAYYGVDSIIGYWD